MHKEVAKHYLSLKINPVPIGKEKEALRVGHSNIRITEEEINKFSWDRIGVSTGHVSSGLEALDFDLKNVDDPGRIMNRFLAKVSKELIDKLVILKTPSGGYHMLYRCMDVGSSQKLAKSDEGSAVIETRGEGSYVVTYPTEGYELMQGDYNNIPIISPEERLELFVAARMLDKQLEKDLSRNKHIHTDFLDKFPSYDKDVNIGIALLEEAGWTIHSEDEDWVNFTRPGKTQGISGGYNKPLRFFYCFTTSTNFEEGKPYNNHALFAELQCNGRYDVAYAKLFEAGHGNVEKRDLEKVGWDFKLKNLLFLSTPQIEKDYLEAAARGEIQQGLSTGWPELDKHFLLKPNTVNMGLGFDGVGKSFFTLSLAMSAYINHGWKWGIIAPENKASMNRRRLMEMLSGLKITELAKYPTFYKKYEQEVYDNFFIASNDYFYSMSDVFDIGKKLYEEFGINALLVDPYNFFKVPTENSYSWNNEVLSMARVFSQQFCSAYIMAHPKSEATRTNLDSNGYLMAPSPYSIQGGADFPYRVDDFFVIHRVKNHPDPNIRSKMQFMLTKLKEDETGGQVHSLGDYTALQWQTKDGFTGYWDASGANPMYRRIAGDKIPMTTSVNPKIDNIF